MLELDGNNHILVAVQSQTTQLTSITATELHSALFQHIVTVLNQQLSYNDIVMFHSQCLDKLHLTCRLINLLQFKSMLLTPLELDQSVLLTLKESLSRLYQLLHHILQLLSVMTSTVLLSRSKLSLDLKLEAAALCTTILSGTLELLDRFGILTVAN